MIWGNRIFFALVAIAILQTVYYYPQMPEIVASHWDGLGAPNDWSSRNGFFGLYLAIVLMLVGIFVYIPKRSMRQKQMGLKIPHPEYWLAPERIAQTHLFFRRQMIVIGIVHLLLSISVMQLAIEANFNPGSGLDSSVFWLLALYFVFLAVWLIHFFLYFRKP